MNAAHAMPFGAMLLPGGGTRFRLWAPTARRVELLVDGAAASTSTPMQALPGGWHEVIVADAAAGTRYRYRIDGGLAVPDPASRCNPDDVHGASLVVDPHAHDWLDAGWCGRPWREAVVYELHVGTFTPEGSFAAASARLSELAALGITAVELMPVAEFPGRRGWGYDGVLPFAPEASYGTPDDLKRLVDHAHALGLMVLLDVVYNHFGPEGNYLHAYCPEFFNPRHQTPWGAAINFDAAGSRTVREFFVHNALYWIEEFRFDGLRLDAVHAIHDTSDEHIVCEIARALRDGPGRERHVHLVLENDANQARLLARDASGAARCADAQWNDDLHHAAHVLVTGETDGYYADYADAPLAHLGRALAQGFAYQGQASALRGGAPRGEPSGMLPGTAFVSFLQNHDQIGNRAFGDRLASDRHPHRLRALLACLLLSPHVPMLFMGEEFAASTPFQYFCDVGPELAAAVATGRRDEFRRFAAFRDDAARARIPDPNAPSTFDASKLRWDEHAVTPHRERLMLVGELLALRARWLVPRLAGQHSGGIYRIRTGLLEVAWPLADGARWHLVTNLGDRAVETAELPPGQPLYAHGLAPADAAARHALAPGAVLVALEAAHG